MPKPICSKNAADKRRGRAHQVTESQYQKESRHLKFQRGAMLRLCLAVALRLGIGSLVRLMQSSYTPRTALMFPLVLTVLNRDIEPF